MTKREPKRRLVVKVKRLSERAQVPHVANDGDVAFDLYSVEEHVLQPQERCAVPTGIALEIPPGYEGQVRPRSGLALHDGVSVLNSPGTIDSGYRGEVKVIVINLSSEEFVVSQGMRIAQLAIREVPDIIFAEVDELSNTERGEGGFGSSGK